MYVCEEHGQQKDDMCGECLKKLVCDCSGIEYDRWKHLHYGVVGDFAITISIKYCDCCGDVKSMTEG